MEDLPLEVFKDRLDFASFDGRRILHMDVSEEKTQELIERKKNKRRKLRAEATDELPIVDKAVPPQLPA